MLSKAAVIWILILNLQEADFYPGGLPEPRPAPGPDPETAKSYLPLSFMHGSCTHPGTVARNEIEFTLVDLDGWYRLLWAAPDRYYYDDLSLFLQGLECPTAADPSGRWRLRIEYHRACSDPVPAAVELEYGLSVGTADDEFASDDSGLLRFGRRFTGALRNYETRFSGAVLNTPVGIVWTLQTVRVFR